MRTHLQGALLLLFLAGAIWGAAQLAKPALSDALDDDGALVTEPGEAEDVVNLATDADEPLTPDELADLQLALALDGLLDLETDVDGIRGERTETAVTEARERHSLVGGSERDLLEYYRAVAAEAAGVTTTSLPAIP